VEATSAAEAAVDSEAVIAAVNRCATQNEVVIAAVNRCATQNQARDRVSPQPLNVVSFPFVPPI